MATRSEKSAEAIVAASLGRKAEREGVPYDMLMREALRQMQGTPQGGPQPLLLANVLLDQVDQELARRGHCFVRYADDADVYVRSQRAGEREMTLLRKMYAKLHLTVNEAKSAVASAFGRKFLGFSFWLAPRGDQTRCGGQAAGDLQAADQTTDSPCVRSQYGGSR